MIQLTDCPPVTFVKRRNQRSLRIRVKSDAIVVSAPLRCSEHQMAGFLREREDWVRKTVQRLAGQRRDRSSLLNEYKGFTLLYGQWLPMVHRPSRPGSDDWLMVWRGDRVDVYPPEGIDVSTLLRAHPDTATDFPEKQLTLIEVPSEVRIRFEKEWARNLLPAEFEQVAKFLPFSWSRVFIRSQKTKWGTCSSKGNISLNWRLIKCPEFIRRYIIIHELCHTVHMNHSKAYWSLLRTHFAGVDEAHQWLKSEGELTFL